MSKLAVRLSAFAASILVVAGLKTQASQQDAVKKQKGTHQQPKPAVAKPNVSTNPVFKTEAFKTVDDIQIASYKAKTLTDDQLKTLNAYVDNRSIMIRLMVMAALLNAGPKQAQAASVIARRGFDSEDSMTRTYALAALDHLNAPDILPVAKSMLADPSHYVTQEAHRILKRRGAES